MGYVLGHFLDDLGKKETFGAIFLRDRRRWKQESSRCLRCPRTGREGGDPAADAALRRKLRASEREGGKFGYRLITDKKTRKEEREKRERKK